MKTKIITLMAMLATITMVFSQEDTRRYDDSPFTIHEQAAQNIRQKARRAKTLFARSLTDIHNELISTGNPQAVLDAFGEFAGEAVADHGASIQLMEHLGYLVPKLPEGSITINSDGTVTIDLTGLSGEAEASDEDPVAEQE